MKLHENVLFGANDIQTVKKIYDKSTYNLIVCDSDSEKNLVNTIVNNLGFSTSDATDPLIYCCLHAASYGPDTNSNPLLRYMLALDTKTGNSYYKNVSRILTFIENKTIEIGDTVEYYLLNQSLYNRSDRDFEYAVKAFDAVINKKDKYFNARNNAVSVHIPEDKIELFFDADTGFYYGEKGSDNYTGDEYAKNVVTSDVPIDQKYFFSGKSVSKTDNIIPSGVSGSNQNQRTIWNYMEIWTNDVNRNSTEDKEVEMNRTIRKRKQNSVQRAKDIINSKDNNLSDKNREELIDIMDMLTR